MLVASARLETCLRVVRRAEKVRDLQHAHVHDNRGQLVLAAEAALNDVHSQVAQTSAGPSVIIGQHQVFGVVLRAIEEMQAETRQNRQLLEGIIGDVDNIKSRVTHLEEALASSHLASARGRCLAICYRVAAFSQEKCGVGL